MASRGSKVASVVWAVLIAVGIIALAGSVLLPSTKRARIDFDQFRNRPNADPATAPAVDPASRPVSP